MEVGRRKQGVGRWNDEMMEDGKVENWELGNLETWKLGNLEK